MDGGALERQEDQMPVADVVSTGDLMGRDLGVVDVEMAEGGWELVEVDEPFMAVLVSIFRSLLSSCVFNYNSAFGFSPPDSGAEVSVTSTTDFGGDRPREEPSVVPGVVGSFSKL